MRTVIAYRNDVIKIRIPAQMLNGVLRNGNNILINADLIPGSGLSKKQVAAKIKAGKITPEIEALGMQIGDNGNGLVVRWADEVQAEKQAKAKADYDALPADVRSGREERMAIEDLYNRSHKALNYDTDEMNVDRGYRLRAEANQRIKAWRMNYPDQAKEEKRREMLAEADHQDSLASGAMTYDADGWISPAEQQKRSDEFKAKAASIRTQANNLN